MSKYKPDPDPKALEKTPYKVGHVVIANYKGILYPAKVTDVQFDEDNPTTVIHRIHYLGWNDRWDEWLEADDLMKADEHGFTAAQNQRKKIEEMKGGINVEKKRKGEQIESSSSSSSSSSSAPPAKRQKTTEKPSTTPTEEKQPLIPSVPPPVVIDITMDYEEASPSHLNINIVGSLKKQLLNDWERITQRHELVPLPRKPSVNEILSEYLIIKGRTPEHQRQVEELIGGVVILFDRCLPVSLLYKFERPNYIDMKLTYKNTPPSMYYGSEHLLRLFVRLPALLSRAVMDSSELAVLECRIGEFLTWLRGKAEVYFCNEYLQTDKDYRRRASTV